MSTKFTENLIWFLGLGYVMLVRLGYGLVLLVANKKTKT